VKEDGEGVIRVRSVDQVRHTLCHGHTAHVRGVLLPSVRYTLTELCGALESWTAVSCADDGSVRVWTADGHCRNRLDLQPDGDLLAVIMHTYTGTLVSASRARVLHTHTATLSKKRTLDTTAKLTVQPGAALSLLAVPHCLAQAGAFVLVGDSCGVISVYSLLGDDADPMGTASVACALVVALRWCSVCSAMVPCVFCIVLSVYASVVFCVLCFGLCVVLF
jgi:hypothetical protein